MMADQSGAPSEKQPTDYVPQEPSSMHDGQQTVNPPQQQFGYPSQGYRSTPQEQGGYPPQQQTGYPPQQQTGYAPQQQIGYAPLQQTGYPPQQWSGYPPEQQTGYPPEQQVQHGAYPVNQEQYQPAGNPSYVQGPPAYSGQGAPQLQTETHQVVVVQQQPRVSVTHTRQASGDHGLIFAVIASFCVFFFGSWLSLACTIPAIFVATQAQDAEARGDLETMRNQRNLSYGLTSAGIVFTLITWVVVIVIIIV